MIRAGTRAGRDMPQAPSISLAAWRVAQTVNNGGKERATGFLAWSWHTGLRHDGVWERIKGRTNGLGATWNSCIVIIHGSS